MPPSASEPDLSQARAAGRMAGLPPWPVLVATIGNQCPPQAGKAAPLVDHSRTTCLRHMASVIRSPNAGALVQLGLSGRTDVYHFLVSTRGSEPALSKRLGIDRDGQLHVWRPLVIAGTEAQGEAALGHGLTLRITTGMPAGIGRRVLVTGRHDARLRRLHGVIG